MKPKKPARILLVDIRRRFVGQRVAGVPWDDADDCSITASGGIVKACRGHDGLGPHVQVELLPPATQPPENIRTNCWTVEDMKPYLVKGDYGYTTRCEAGSVAYNGYMAELKKAKA